MKDHIRFPLRHTDAVDVSILPPRDSDDFLSLVFHTKNLAGTITDFSVYCGPNDLLGLALLHRALGHCLDVYCPGLASPLPHYAFEEQDEANRQKEKLDREWNRINLEGD